MDRGVHDSDFEMTPPLFSGCARFLMYRSADFFVCRQDTTPIRSSAIANIVIFRYTIRPVAMLISCVTGTFFMSSKKPAAAAIDIDAVLKALANPVRREILGWLRDPYAHFADQELPLDHGVCAGKIDARCGLSQSTVSAHLAALQRAGLVTSKRVGQWVFFKRNDAVIKAFIERMNTEL